MKEEGGEDETFVQLLTVKNAKSVALYLDSNSIHVVVSNMQETQKY